MKCLRYGITSRLLRRYLPYDVYGHSGRPILVFPTQNGKCGDYGQFKMPETIADRIEKGEVQLFCVDSIDKETWDIDLNFERCIACGSCLTACPTHAVTLSI